MQIGQTRTTIVSVVILDDIWTTQMQRVAQSCNLVLTSRMNWSRNIECAKYPAIQ